MAKPTLFLKLIESSAQDIHSSSIEVQEAFIRSAPLAPLTKWIDSSISLPLPLIKLARTRALTLEEESPHQAALFWKAWAGHAQLEDVLEFANSRQGLRTLSAFSVTSDGYGLSTLRKALKSEPGFADGVLYSTLDSLTLLSEEQREVIFEALVKSYSSGFKFFLRDNRDQITSKLNFPGLRLRILELGLVTDIFQSDWPDTPEVRAAIFKRLASFGSTHRAWHYWHHAFNCFAPGSASAKEIRFYFKNFLWRLTPLEVLQVQWWLDPEGFDLDSVPSELRPQLDSFRNMVNKRHPDPEMRRAKLEQVKVENKRKTVQALRDEVNRAHKEAVSMNVSFAASEQELLVTLGSSFTLPALASLDKETFETLTRDAISLSDQDFELRQAVSTWVETRSSLTPAAASWLLLWNVWTFREDRGHTSRLSRISMPERFTMWLVLNRTSNDAALYRRLVTPVFKALDLEAFYQEFEIWRPLITTHVLYHPLSPIKTVKQLLESWGFLPATEVFSNLTMPKVLLEFLVHIGKGDINTPAVLLDSFTGTLKEFSIVVSELAPDNKS